MGERMFNNQNITIKAGKEINVLGSLKLNGTTVTASASEMNALTGITSSVAELNILTGVTATATEINVLDNAVSSGIVANKAVIADANSKINLAKLGSAASSASGLLMGVGTTIAPASTAVADAKFVEVRAKTTATSGDNRLAYLRYDINGAGAGGETIRALTDLTAEASTANGAHISLQAGATGYITGLGTGVRSQLYIKDEVVAANGTYYGAMAEIFSEGSTSSLAGVTKHAIFNIAATGDATGAATVLNAIAVDGISAADTTKMISSVSLAELPAGTVGIAVLVNGVRYYMPLVAVAEWN